MSRTNLSRRGAKASSHGGENQIWDVLANLYHPTRNPKGFVSLGVAENALMHGELAKYLESRFRVPHPALTYGDGATGSHRLKDAVARFLTRRLKPVTPIRREHIVVTNGVSTAVENCSWALANPGDGFLLGQPYYRAFLSDISLRPGTKVVPVPFGSIDPFGPGAVSRYEEALLKSQKNGTQIKGLILAHPHNPLGRCYPRDTLIALMELCQKYQVHFISDEIYAFSVWENTVDFPATSSQSQGPTPFISALSIDLSGIIDPSLVHFVWGVSKDFGANGLRLGCVISQSNQAFLNACGSVGLYTYASSLPDLLVADLLSDDTYVDWYIAENQRRLSKAYAFATGLLKRAEIEYAPGGNAAFFLWINLGKAYLSRHPKLARQFLGQNGVEKRITQHIYDRLMEKKIFLASGDATGAEEPGWFRVVFTQPRDMVEMGLKRIIDAVSDPAENKIQSKL